MNGLYMKERRNTYTPTRRATKKVQFMNICQLATTIVTYLTYSMLILLMLTLLLLTKQIIGTNCYLKKHY